MKILLLTIGSQGDVDPYIALGKGLLKRGHQVDLCTSAKFQTLVETNGLTYRYLSDDLFLLMEGGTLEKMGSLFSGIKTALTLIKKAKPLNHELIIDSINAGLVSEPDLVIYHPKCLAAVSIAEKFNVPAIMGVLQPLVVKTNAFPPAGLPNLGQVINKLSYTLVRLGYAHYAKELNQQRRLQLGLPPLSRNKGVLSHSDGKPIPVLHAFSKYLVRRPKDWPSDAEIVGEWRLKSESCRYTPPKELTTFLSLGPLPVYIGFGSMVGKDPDHIGNVIFDAVAKAGVRAIIATGWGGIKINHASDNILVIKSVPHDWLFPKVAAVVHHGGAGTTTAGLLAAKPTLICPFFGDQPFWGNLVYKHGLGPTPIKQSRLNLANLSHALTQLVSSSEFQKNVCNMAELLAQEDGIETTFTWLEREQYLKNSRTLAFNHTPIP